MNPLDDIRPAEVKYPQPLGCNPGPDILSCYQFHIFEIINFVILCNIIGICGVVANIINIIIFSKQGFANTVNISFFSMAISDMCCLITLLWVSMCLNPLLNAQGVPYVPEEFVYLSGAWPHVIFGRITSFITVFITAERCLSIITPLKVKQIITPKKTIIVNSLIYIINILTMVPELSTSYLDFKIFPERNATLLAIYFASNRDDYTSLVYFMSSITGISSFLGVIIWTVILVVNLRKNSQWRQKVSNDSEGTISSRDKKTTKMVAIIASVLIVCYTPGSVVAMATVFEPELNIGKRYVNLVMALWSIAFVFQSVNSSVNIFLYYSMSSNYRRTLDRLFAGVFKHFKKQAKILEM